MEMTLDKLVNNQSGRIVSVKGKGALHNHLLDMGLTPGTEVTLIKRAPMGDPIEFELRGYELTIRLSEAENIVIEPVLRAASENNKEKHTWDIRKILIDAGADQKIVDIDGKTAADWVSEYHESGPTRKQFNRGSNKNSQKRGNRRW